MSKKSGQRPYAPSQAGVDRLLLRLVVLLSVSSTLTVSIGETTTESQSRRRSGDATPGTQAQTIVTSDPQKELPPSENINRYALHIFNIDNTGLISEKEFIGDRETAGTGPIVESAAIDADDVEQKMGKLPIASQAVIVSNVSGPYINRSQEEIEFYETQLNASTMNDTIIGRRFRRQAYSSECAYIALRGHGIVASPFYPSNYENYHHCIWILEAATGCGAIFLQVLHFSTEWCCDILQIDDSTGYQTTLYGSTYSQFYTLQSPVRLTFTTDYSRVYTGFEIAFSSLQCSSGYVCGTTYLRGSGVIRSPGFPLHYQNNIACQWRLEAEWGNSAVFLRIMLFSTEYRYDHVRFYSSSGYYTSRHGLSSGWIRLVTPAIVTFATDSSGTDSGFEIAFRGLPPYISTPGDECHYSLPSSGIISSPNFPASYGNELACSWELESASGDDAIALIIWQFSTENGYDNLRVLSTTEDVTSYSGAVGPRVEIFDLPVYMSFTTDASVVSTGFKIEYRTLQRYSTSSGAECRDSYYGSGILRSPAYLGNYPNNVICSWTVNAQDNSGVVMIRIVNFSTEHCCDRLRISSSTSLHALLTGSVQPQLFILSSPAFISFTADGSVTSSGFEIIFSSVTQSAYNGATANECGSSLTASGIIRSPGYPRSYPGSISCLWRLEAASEKMGVFLQILDISINYYRDYLTISNLTQIQHRIYREPYQRFFFLGSPTFLTFTTSLFGNFRGFQIAFSSKPLPSHNTGYECGSTMTGSGVIRTPNYPANYGNYMTCFWRLESALANGDVFLQVLHFSTEQHYDILRIYDDTGLKFNISGVASIQVAMVKSPAYITFTTDVSVVSSGFEIAFSSTRSRSDNASAEARDDCGASMTGSGILRSPSFPRHYGENIVCFWSLEAASGNSAIVLQLLHFSTQFCCDHVRIFNNAGLQETVSGVTERRSIVIESPAIVTFTTDGSGTSTGFEIAFTSVRSASTDSATGGPCGETLIGSGIIRLPDNGESYSNNFGCYWRLEAPFVNGAIFLQILEFSTEPCCDYLRVANSSDIYTSISGVIEPLSMTLESTAFVTFTSDSSISSTGFLITFSSFSLATNETGTECGGYLTGSGIIRSPAYPDNYRDYIACHWTVEAASGNDYIFLQILSFSTEKCCDYLQIFNTTGLIMSYSGEPGPQFMTVESPVIVTFTTDGSVTSAGFEIAFTSVESASGEPDDDCRRSMTGFGVIRSPGYPGHYPSNIACLYRLEAAPGYSAIFLEILHFNTESCCAHLRISNGSGYIQTTISGAAGLHNLTLESPTFISFTTNSSGNFTGFEIAFSSVSPNSSDGDIYAECGSTIYSPGVIKSLPIHEPRQEEINCSWSLKSRHSENYSIQLTLSSLSMRQCCDFLEIADDSGFRYTFSGSIELRPRISLHLPASAMVSFISRNVSIQSHSEFRIFVDEVPGSVHGICHTGNWSVQGTSCFRVLPSLGGISWNKARSLCRSIGGLLVEIESSDEQKNVEDYLINHVQSSDDVWIGLKRGVSTEDPWLWDSGKPPTYTNWTAGQPTSASANDMCTALSFRNRLGWNTSDCRLLKVPLCMLRPSTT